MKVKFFLEELSDKFLVENFKRVRDLFQETKLFNGEFQFFEIQIPMAMTNYRHAHYLGFQPKDILQTSLVGTGALSWNYDKFTRDFLDITTTGPCTVRAFIGSYKEE